VQQRVERVWVRLEADGVEGWGEADPSPFYGETADTVVTTLGRLKPVLEAVGDPEDLERIEQLLGDAMRHNAAGRAAVSAALHDLVGKRAGLPLWKLLGLAPDEAPESSFTIGLDEPDVVAAKVREASRYPILKIKVGTAQDDELLDAVREAAPDKTIRVDANAAWTPRQALHRIERMAEYGVEFVEQPLPPWNRAGYRFLHERSPLPVIVDESCVTAVDVPGLVGLADGINIKLAKCGGPREALRMIHTARACGLHVMMGCMLETTLGIAPAAHLSPLLDYADLDGAALIKDDPFRGPHLDAGRIVLGDEAGLGVERS
jgi:L-alanine-DL-glutamate epimerase-like enolase superfamily enzyme